MDIILIGRIAEAGALETIDSHKELLEQRYGLQYLTRGILGLEAEFADEECMRILNRADCDVFVVGKQGIFKALWAMGETLSCGLRVHLRDIPVSQFSIEMSELIDESPYLINSLGCILVCTDSGIKLKDELRSAGYPAEVIGYTTDDNARAIINNDNLTYLTP